MKRLILIPVVLMLAACQKPVDEWTQTPPLDLKTIKGLEDCTYSRVYTGSNHLYIVRCPGSTVSTTTSGKNPVNTITVDGVEYVQK